MTKKLLYIMYLSPVRELLAIENQTKRDRPRNRKGGEIEGESEREQDNERTEDRSERGSSM